MRSRLFSLTALPLALAGHLLFWAGSATLLRSAQTFSGPDVAAIAFVAAGILVTIAAMATVAIGSLGAYLVGALLLLFSLLVHLLPISGASPAFALIGVVRSGSWATSDGVYFYFLPGVGAVVGAVFVAAALAADRRRTAEPSTRGRALSGLTAIVGLGGLLLALVTGWSVYADLVVILQPPSPLDMVLLYLGAVLAAAPLVAAMRSSAGAIIAGSVVVAGAIFESASPWALTSNQIDPFLRRGIDFAGPSGELLLLGLLMVVAGFAVRAGGRRNRVVEHTATITD
ncbi:MAG: hypothetical protein JWP32_486 [Schumannella sp.]|nr:hypothetical protein [Schumannella sp.]